VQPLLVLLTRERLAHDGSSELPWEAISDFDQDAQ
jgi:hypothetical protein